MSERARALLVGLAVGDALGAPVEFRERDYLRYHPVQGLMGHPVTGAPAGSWSEESAMAFAVGESLIGGFDLPRIATGLVNWGHGGRWSVDGTAPEGESHLLRAIDRLDILLAAGMADRLSDLREERSTGQSANAALLRCPALAFAMQYDDDAQRFDRIWAVSALTQPDLQSAIACHIYLDLAIALLGGQSFGEAWMVMTATLDRRLGQIGILPADRKPFERILSGRLLSVPEEHLNSRGYAVETLESALWSAMNSTNYAETVTRAANLGEDADATAALAGSLAGLAYGARAIPSPWVLALPRLEEILELCDALGESWTAVALQRSA